MTTSLTLLELLSEIGGVDLSFRRRDACIAVAVITLLGGRQLLAVERTYREGTCVIIEPTQDEV